MYSCQDEQATHRIDGAPDVVQEVEARVKGLLTDPLLHNEAHERWWLFFTRRIKELAGGWLLLVLGAGLMGWLIIFATRSGWFGKVT